MSKTHSRSSSGAKAGGIERFVLSDEAVAAALARQTRVVARLTVPLFVGVGAMLGGPCGLGFGEPIGALIGVFAGAALGASGARITLRRQQAERLREVAAFPMRVPRERTLQVRSDGLVVHLGGRWTFVPWNRVTGVDKDGPLAVAVGQWRGDLVWAPAALADRLQPPPTPTAFSEPPAPAAFTARYRFDAEARNALSGSVGAAMALRTRVGLIGMPLLLLAGSVAASAEPTTVAALAWAALDFVLLATAGVWLPRVGGWLLNQPGRPPETVLYVREEGLETRCDGFVDHAPWSWIREVREHPTHALIRDGADHWYVFPKSATPDPEGLLAFVRVRVVAEPPPVAPLAVPPPAAERETDNPFAAPSG